MVSSHFSLPVNWLPKSQKNKKWLRSIQKWLRCSLQLRKGLQCWLQRVNKGINEREYSLRSFRKRSIQTHPLCVHWTWIAKLKSELNFSGFHTCRLLNYREDLIFFRSLRLSPCNFWLCLSLYRECNRRHQVLSVFVEFYAAIYLQVYQVWKHQHKTITDSGFVLREAEKLAKKRPRDLIRNLERVLADRQNLIKVDEDNFSPKAKQPDILDRFAGVCDLKVDEEEEVHLV